MSRGLVLVVALAVGLGVTGWQVYATSRAAGPALPVLSTLGGDFRMDSTLGTSASMSQFRDEVVLLNFGFTSCPHVCPTVLARMRDTIQALPAGQVSVRPVFVTLDPQRDTIERLQAYLSAFGDSFVGLSGSPEELAQAAAAYKVHYEGDDGGSFLHSSQIYLLDKQGNTRATFGQSVTVAKIVATVRQLLEEST